MTDYDDHEEPEERQTQHWCGRCPQRGQLLPARKGWLKCSECAGETIDAWGLTTGLTVRDYQAYASLAKQLRATRKQQRDCPHKRVTVSLRPYCSACGLVLDREHPLARAALKRLEGMKQTGSLAEVLGRVG
jgi:hypothetical protein